ncbi:MAG: phenylalanine--tRNA ligase subunit alpha, partial [Halodesulfurarchaeum sp.]
MKLPRQQLAVLERTSADEPTDIQTLAEQLETKPETVTGAAFALEEEGLLEVRESTGTAVELTAEGRTYLDEGLPEVALYRTARELGAADDPVPLGEVIDGAALDGPQVDIALSNFARKGYGSIEDGDLVVDPDADPEAVREAAALERIERGEPVDEDLLEALERRGLVRVNERTTRSVVLTEEGVTELMAGIEPREAVDRVTPEHLTDGTWREVDFAEYDVAADAAEPTPGKVHILRQAAERVKEVLVGMGFEEMEGPHVDADFWINDCLFMPQDHPARTHWDRFAMARPKKIDELPADLVERVKRAHREGVGEDGDGYHSPWDVEFAKELALRGHTTSLSARYLSGEQVGELDPPQRFFSVEKAYRNDTLDATHLLEFFQIEGW